MPIRASSSSRFTTIAFVAAADAYEAARAAYEAVSYDDPRNDEFERAFLHAHEPMEAAEPATLDEFARKFVLCFADGGNPRSHVVRAMSTSARRLLGHERRQ